MAIEVSVSCDFRRLLEVQGAPPNWENKFESFDEVLHLCQEIACPFEDSVGDFWVLGTTPGGTTVFIEYVDGLFFENWLLSSGKRIEMVEIICKG